MWIEGREGWACLCLLRTNRDSLSSINLHSGRSFSLHHSSSRQLAVCGKQWKSFVCTICDFLRQKSFQLLLKMSTIEALRWEFMWSHQGETFPFQRLKIDLTKCNKGKEIKQRTPETHVYVSRHQQPEILLIFFFFTSIRYSVEIRG